MLSPGQAAGPSREEAMAILEELYRAGPGPPLLVAVQASLPLQTGRCGP